MSVTLRTRLTAVYSAVFGLLLAGVSFVSYRTFTQALDRNATVRAAELAEGLHGFIRFRSDAPTIEFDSEDTSAAAFVREATEFYEIYDRATGQRLASSRGFDFLGPPLSPDAVRSATTPPVPVDASSNQGRVRVYSSFGERPSGHQYLLRVGAETAAADAALERYRALLVWRVPIAVGLAVLISWWMAGFALAPLSGLAATARKIDIANLAVRLRVRGVGDELDEVALAFNDTLARLESAVTEMRQFSTALAHELRTPLTVLRASIETELLARPTDERQQTVLIEQVEEIDRLKRLIDQLLTLARAQAGQIHVVRGPVDLAALTTTLVDQIAPVAEARGLTLTVDSSAEVTVAGDAFWLERLILNLVDNAVKYTPAGGRVRVGVSGADGGAALTVEDSGIGFDPALGPRLFDRFFRVDGARAPAGGAGLGLSLVRWIVEAHGGRIRVASRPGSGSTFTVWLPTLRPT